MRGSGLVLAAAAACVCACAEDMPVASARARPVVPDVSEWVAGPQDWSDLAIPGDGARPDGDSTWADTLRLGAEPERAAHADASLQSPAFACCAVPKPGSTCQLRFSLFTELHDGERLRLSLSTEVGPPDARVTRVVDGWVASSATSRTYSLTVSPCGSAVRARFSWDAGEDQAAVTSRAYLTSVEARCLPAGRTNFGPGVTGTLVDASGRELPREPSSRVLH
jgi:hypothetical protein